MRVTKKEARFPWAVVSPDGVQWLGLCDDELHAWEIALGWHKPKGA